MSSLFSRVKLTDISPRQLNALLISRFSPATKITKPNVMAWKCLHAFVPSVIPLTRLPI